MQARAIVRYAAALVIPAVFITPADAQLSVPSGVYVRGEVGGALHQNITFTDASPTAPNCDLCGASFPSSVGGSVVFGAGFGYRLTPMFRADMTLDYLTSTKVSGHSTASIPSAGSANLDSFVGLVNGYLDLGEFESNALGAFQPYIDAGIGFAENHLGTTTGNSGAVGPFTLSSGTQTNFAWAVGAGVAYPLTPRLTADLAYRFLGLGQVVDGTTLRAAGSSFQVTPSKTGSADAQTLTIGLRYAF